MYEKPLQSLKERIAKEGSKAVFTPIIEKYILNNSHRVTIEMQVFHGPKFTSHVNEMGEYFVYFLFLMIFLFFKICIA